VRVVSRAGWLRAEAAHARAVSRGLHAWAGEERADRAVSLLAAAAAEHERAAGLDVRALAIDLAAARGCS
jgi:hypothetical protein